ncbi:hypothetical protein NDU88_004360 [Pleurodeles waltl]|uniref:Uncharacterized protein n=1 Tax=Pleurodeles waltl TaxID=8319 RepID=A0AAV7VK49_PLEWA|nr:hypothetical protein NDU88_004360 [Pleurodeles waltl]
MVDSRCPTAHQNRNLQRGRSPPVLILAYLDVTWKSLLLLFPCRLRRSLPASPLWGRMAAREVLLLLPGEASTSLGDREPIYRDCVSQCDWSNCTGDRGPPWGRMAALAALLLLLGRPASASRGDREPMYWDCMSQCDWSNCTGARKAAVEGAASLLLEPDG